MLAKNITCLDFATNESALWFNIPVTVGILQHEVLRYLHTSTSPSRHFWGSPDGCYSWATTTRTRITS